MPQNPVRPMVGGQCERQEVEICKRPNPQTLCAKFLGSKLWKKDLALSAFNFGTLSVQNCRRQLSHRVSGDNGLGLIEKVFGERVTPTSCQPKLGQPAGERNNNAIMRFDPRHPRVPPRQGDQTENQGTCATTQTNTT